MTDTELLLFSYLRSGLWGCPPPAPCPPAGDGRWRQLFGLACRQAVAGIVADGIARGGARPGGGLWQQWLLYLVHLEQVNRRIDGYGQRLLAMLRAEGISGEIVKGAAVARFYPEPLHRSYGDIDIVVTHGWPLLPAALRRRGIAFYGESGDIVADDIGPRLDGCATPAGGHRCRAEFHPRYERLFSPLAAARLRRIARGGQEQNALPGPGSAEFALACIVLHLRRHVLSYGIGLKQVCDVAVMARRSGADLQALAALLRHLGTWRFGRALLAFIDDHLACPGYPPLAPGAGGKAAGLLLSVFMGDGYTLKAEREDSGRLLPAPLRVARNALFWLRRSLHLFSLMPAEAFFFMASKAAGKLKIKN